MTTFTNNSYLDATILKWLQIQDLPNISLLSSSFHSLTQSELFWDCLLQQKYGKKVLTLKGLDSGKYSSKEIYQQLASVPHNSAGYNFALITKRPIAIAWLKLIGVQSNIEQFPSNWKKTLRRASPDLLEFFQNVNLGPIVLGNFSRYQSQADPTQYFGTRVNGYSVIRKSALQQILYCFQPNNPLYGILTTDLSRLLFSFHFKVLKIRKDGRYYSASSDMRKYLGKLMEDLIDHHINLVVDRGILNSNEAEQKRNLLKSAIVDPSVVVEDIPISRYSRNMLVFNPNRFSETAFSQLLTFGKDESKIRKREYELIQEQVSQEFNHLESASNLGNMIQLQYRCCLLTRKYFYKQK